MAFTITTDLFPSDATELGKIRTAAFQQSKSTQVRLLNDQHYGLIEQWSTANEEVDLSNHLRNKSVAIVKTADENGEDGPKPTGSASGAKKVISYARWSHPKDSTNETAQSQGTAPNERDYDAELHELRNNPDLLPPGTNIEFRKAFRAGLDKGRKNYLDEEKDWCLEILCTDPEFFRQGHGSTLLTWGTERADAAKVRIYVESTLEGMPLYKRHGWKLLDELTWNLADYGIEVPENSEGKSRVFLMMREAAV